MTNEELKSGIKDLKKEKNALILAHNYQLAEVQEIADYVGDSLGLSRTAQDSTEDIIVFCGVNFMAETASILCPDKKILIPAEGIGCSLASSISAMELRLWKEKNPGALVLSYVNTTADVKAESDYSVTSANAAAVMGSIPEDKKILFLPDKYLGQYCIEVTGRKNVEIWDGCCHVHYEIDFKQAEQSMKEHPFCELLLHPESPAAAIYSRKSIRNVIIASTEGMIKHVSKSSGKEFIIGTEIGILHRFRKMFPDRLFYPVNHSAECRYMKQVNLENIYQCLLLEKYQITVDDHIRKKAIEPIKRMLSF